MTPEERELLQHTYQLAKDNNRMLRAMRRNAFITGAVRLLVWAAFIIIPFWLYMQYLAPQVNQAMQAMNQLNGSMQQVQGVGANAQVQLNGLLDKLKALPGGQSN